MSPPPPSKQPGAGVGAGAGDHPLPVVGSDRPQTPVDDGGKFLIFLVSVLLPTLSTCQRS